MLTEEKQITELQERAALRDLTPDAMADIGLETHVYVRPMQARDLADEIKGQIDVQPDTWLYAVHAANGVRVAIVDTRVGAFDGARAYGYEPLSVH
jgi:hypothetical protein